MFGFIIIDLNPPIFLALAQFFQHELLIIDVLLNYYVVITITALTGCYHGADPLMNLML